MDGWTFPLCLEPPDWRVRWDEIEARFPWIRAMAGTPQDPAHHAEGDVLVHTRMVAEALAGLDAWRSLDAEGRATLFLAALLHDVAKPTCTVTEADGRIASPRHARVGAAMARSLLWEGGGFDAPIAFPAREAVARLVRHHGLPLWFWDKADPERAVGAASQAARLDWVALLAEADVRGRICADQAGLLDRIALFRDYCTELGCGDCPRAFADAHSRFVYFRGRPGDARYRAHDDTVCEVVMMSGLPAAGKDTWIRANLPNWPVVSLDGLRAELGVDPADGQGAVVRAAKGRARELLRRRASFVWNATNVTRALRGSLIDLFAAYRARVRIVYVDAPYAALLRRNAARARPVPERVIRTLLRKLEVPDATEAQRVTWVYEQDGEMRNREVAGA